MHKIEINTDLYMLPECWDELTLDQLLYLARLTSTEMPVQEVKVTMMLYCLHAHIGRHRKVYADRVCLSIRQQSAFRASKKYLLSAEQTCSLADLFDFLTNQYQEGTYVIRPQLTICPIKKLKVGFTRLSLPDEALMSASFDQFTYLQFYQSRMREDITYINHLLAVLFHSEEKFSAENMDKDARLIAKLDPALKTVMYWYYLGSMEFIGSQFPRVFSGGGSVTGNVFESQLRLLDSLAKNDMTKKPAVREGLLYDALMTMDESIRMQEERTEYLANK